MPTPKEWFWLWVATIIALAVLASPIYAAGVAIVTLCLGVMVNALKGLR